MNEQVQYLGDAVYVRVENGLIKLFTSDGYNTIDTIYLEPGVADNLINYIERLKNKTSHDVPPNVSL